MQAVMAAESGASPDGVMDMDDWTTHYDEKQKANYYHNAKTGEVRNK